MKPIVFTPVGSLTTDAIAALADNGYAVTEYYGNVCPVLDGETLRDKFAAKAMQGILADNTVEAEDDSYEALVDFYKRVAEGSYLMADAMLKQRGVR